MARIRSVHPGLFTDEAFVSCSPLARLLVIGLWTEADDQGLFEWKPVTIKMRLLPVDNADVPALLAELSDGNLIKSFSAAGREYGAIRNFRKYQRPKKPNTTHPLPDEFRTYVALDSVSSEPDDDEGNASSEPSTHHRPSIPQKGEKPPQMEDGGDKMKEGEENAHAGAPASSAHRWPNGAFERFWMLFPNKVGRQAAQAKFDVIRKRGTVDFDRLMAGLASYCAKRDDRPWCNPATWLNQGRWDDEPANGLFTSNKSAAGLEKWPSV
jgi:hypothetical protein